MTLEMLRAGRVQVIGITGGRGVRQRLAQLGIYPGSIITVCNRGGWRGPLLVEVGGSRIALGRGMARRIEVQPL